ncbi:MAG: M20/M25/M40 family metallo-hydrolase [Gammaproteobacteria bacterium]|nr:M20/M25/M40 family metallo-hydrolase [Gammaproteobacteria bacterium]
MQTPRLLTWLSLLALAPAALAQEVPAQQQAAIAVATRTIRPEAIRAHMRFLSDSLLEGRAPDSRGYQVAARYVAAELEAMGLRPAGPGNTWFQPVPLRKAVVDPAKSSMTLIADSPGPHPADQALVDGRDYVFPGDVVHAQYTLEGPVAFVGFGVTAPEENYDDYAGLDVRGKIVLTLYGAPAAFESTLRAFYSDDVEKTRNALAHGAIAMIDTLLPEDWQREPWEWSVPQFRMGSTNWLDPAGTPHSAIGTLARLNRSGAEMLFAGAPRSLEEAFAAARSGQHQAFALPWQGRIHTVSTHTTYQSPNIIGKLVGSDPALRDQYVVYTAHVDHLGTCPPIAGDAICHGALDNASGVATLLEIARAYARLQQPPRRSVLFLFVTGEEMGLLGSDYFLQVPTVPLQQLVANINIDEAPGLLFAMKDVVALGAEHSSIGKAVLRAAHELGYTLSPDPMPEEADFIRSDQYSFVQQGVPALYLSDGVAAADPAVNGLALEKKWMVTRYHTPLDNIDQPLDYASGARAATLNFLVGYELGQSNDPPLWNPGNYFGIRFGQHRQAEPAK